MSEPLDRSKRTLGTAHLVEDVSRIAAIKGLLFGYDTVTGAALTC